MSNSEWGLVIVICSLFLWIHGLSGDLRGLRDRLEVLIQRVDKLEPNYDE